MSDGDVTRHCPKCRDVVLKKPGRTGTRVERCYQCHGMWVSAPEAGAIIDAGGLLDPDSMLPQKASGDHLSGLCPDGHGILTRARVDGDEPFHLERCAHCKAIWFDSDDWHKLASTHLVGHLDDLWDPQWQQARRKERFDQILRDKISDAFGEPFLATLDDVARTLEGHPRRSEVLAFLKESSDA